MKDKTVSTVARAVIRSELVNPVMMRPRVCVLWLWSLKSEENQQQHVVTAGLSASRLQTWPRGRALFSVGSVLTSDKTAGRQPQHSCWSGLALLAATSQTSHYSEDVTWLLAHCLVSRIQGVAALERKPSRKEKNNAHFGCFWRSIYLDFFFIGLNCLIWPELYIHYILCIPPLQSSHFTPKYSITKIIASKFQLKYLKIFLIHKNNILS